MKLLKGKKILIAIIFLAAIIRLWNLSSIPPHLTPDEASLGYNAYSILKTGKDEYGEILPLIFKSFGDYKPGLYVYLSVPSIAVFGLNEFGVRFPSALAGIVSVYLLYLIVKKLFDEKLGLISAFLMAVTPWAIYFSRGAWEVNISLTLTLAGIYFFLRAREKTKFLIPSALFFALTLIAYQGAKLSTSIVLAILSLVYWSDVKKWFISQKKILTASFLIGVLIALPILLSFIQGKTGRLKVFSVFSNPRPAEYLEKQLSQGNEKVGDLTYYLFHSETLNFSRGILGRWFNHYSDRFLFFEGDWANPKHGAPNQGVLLFSDIILIVLGIIAIVRYGFKKEVLIVWLWLIFAPLPAVLSRDQIHAVRSLNMVIPLVIILSLGLKTLLEGKRRVLKVFFGLLYLSSFIYFLDSYFIHLPKHNSMYWDWGYKEIVEAVTPIQNNYKSIKVQQSFSQPYIYFLFYQKYDPVKYQKQAKLIESIYKGDVGQVEKLDNICFCPIDWSINRGQKGTLFVADTIRIPPEDSADSNLFKLIKEIRFLGVRNVAFRILEVK